MARLSRKVGVVRCMYKNQKTETRVMAGAHRGWQAADMLRLTRRTALFSALLCVVSCAPAPAVKPAPVTTQPVVAAAEAAQPLLVGKVTRVVDGDTIHVLLSSGDITVRFFAIDTPESNQPGGPEAKAFLSGLVLDREVALEVVNQDRYDRLVARVMLGERDVNGALVRAGHAWVYRLYARDPQMCRDEAAARGAHRGLWAAPPTSWIYPADWRRLRNKKIATPKDFSDETASRCIAALGKR